MRTRQLSCSCCGNNVFEGYQHYNHDIGYGTCKSCKEWIISRNDTPNDQQYKETKVKL